MLDAAARMHPAAPAMAASAAVRLDKLFPSLDVYRTLFQMTPFVRPWYPEMEGFVEADVQGAPAPPLLTTRSRGFAAGLAALHILGVSHQEWIDCAQRVRAPAMLVRATDPFLMGMPMLRDRDGLETAEVLRARYLRVPGNHFTMLFGPGARMIVDAVNQPQPWTAEAPGPARLALVGGAAAKDDGKDDAKGAGAASTS
jgi:hypothetical protein